MKSPIAAVGATFRRVLRKIDHRLLDRRQRALADMLSHSIIPDCRSVLDVGCGIDGELIRMVPNIPHTVGVDLVLPAPASDTEDPAAPRHNEYVEFDARYLSDRFGPQSFDCVVALDLIEHLSKEDGQVLLSDMEAIAAKRVIVFTPNGMVPQPPEADNPYQEHISGWKVKEFTSRGYTVIGVHGWKPLRGMYSNIRWRPRFFWARFSLLTQGLFESRPSFAFHLLAIKDL